MRTLIRIIPLEIKGTYSGTSQQTGNGYRIDTWLAKCPATNVNIVFTCFSDVSDYLTKKKNLEVDGEIFMKSKEYNGKFYNDVTFVNPIRDTEDSNSDLPASTPQPQQQAIPQQSFNNEEEDTGLPF
jgi:hypothetical protein